jgi:hypothetical protein
MAFTADEINNINNSALEHFIRKGRVAIQNVEQKPMLRAFDAAAKTFPGGKEYVSVGVMSGQGGLSLQGYSGDEQVGFGNPVGNKRARYAWKEHHIGMVVTHTELKIDGIDIIDDSADASTSEMSGREEHVLAGILDTKMQMLGEDYAKSMDLLVHGDGTADPKALAGVRSLILDNPGTGTTGGLSRPLNSWWRNRAATAAFAGAGGQGAITVNTANGGALIEFLEKEWLQLVRFAEGTPRWKLFAGSDFIAGYQKELRANGSYTQSGWQGQNNADGGMDGPKFKGNPIEYDPTLDNLGLAKRCYVIDMSLTGIQLYYMMGNRMKKHNPARPYDRYVMYNAITNTSVMVASRLNTSAVYDIA